MPGRCFLFPTVFVAVLLVSGQTERAAADSDLMAADPHYSELGFFDIHICNWPDRPEFFKVLFSTEVFEDIVSMDVYMPNGDPLVSLEKGRYMTIEHKDRPDKRVFMLDIDLPRGASTGWYSIRVKTRSGNEAVARDYVVLSRLERVVGSNPPHDAEAVSMPKELSWTPVPGAKHYQVWLRDAWSNELILGTKILNEPKVSLPNGTLEPGGYYYWTVHARDTNEHILLGDFHMGSMSEKFFFSVAEE